MKNAEVLQREIDHPDFQGSIFRQPDATRAQTT